MNRVDRAFAELRARGERALMAFWMGGDPDLAASLEVLRRLAASGADILEVGLPFSDPIADGPTNQLAAQRALAAGTTPDGVLDLIARYRAEDDRRPVVLLTYMNPVHARGVARLCADARAAGVDALVIPDLSFEESGPVRRAAEEEGLYLIPFLAPTTPPERMRRILAAARGFVYCVSLTGVTGARQGLLGRGLDLVRRARALTEVPLLVGFGISHPDQAAELLPVADGLIVGSALIDRVASRPWPEGVEDACALVRDLKAACRLAPSPRPAP